MSKITQSLTSIEKSTTVRIVRESGRRRPRRTHWLVRRCPWLGTLLLAELFLAPRRRLAPLALGAAASQRQLDIGGRRIVVHLHGEGPLVVLVHGWQGAASQLASLAHSLSAAGFRVAAFDMPGHGEAPGWSTSGVEFISILEGVAAMLGPVFAVVGHSLGGTASIMASARGLGVAGVVAISPMPSFEFALKSHARAYGLSPTMREQLARRLETRLQTRRVDFDLSRVRPPVPVLLVHDLVDRIVPLRHSRRLRDVWQDVRLFQTCGLGHNRVLDAEDVAQAIVAFVLSLPGLAPARHADDSSVARPAEPEPEPEPEPVT